MYYRVAILSVLLAVSTDAAAQTCPAGNPLVAPDSRYTVSELVAGERVVQDLRTGLMWKQCVQGRSGAGCATGADSTLTWTQALSAAASESFAGHSDWRLPSINELRSLVESGCYDPATNTTVFPATPFGSAIWSSTTIPSSVSFAETVGFGDGRFFGSSKTSLLRVRLVRSNQSFDHFDSGLDFTPDPFAFTSQFDVPQSSERISNAIVVGGLTTRTGIQIAGAPGSMYRINGGAWTSVPGNVGNGDEVEVRHTSAAAPATKVISALTIGGVAATFDSATEGYSPPKRRLNDTAQINCYNATTITGTVAPATPNPVDSGFENQDCVRGSAAADALGVLVKTGESTAPGRDYSKIAGNGSVLPASATLGSGPSDWACTRDNVTGLVWEVKVNDAGQLRHFNHTYTWFDSDGSTNGGTAGALGSPASCNSTLPNCNTTAFRAAVNVAGLCGANDWRLPSPQELQSLLLFGPTSGPLVDTTWLPNTANSFYWSGPTYGPDASWAWGVVFDNGFLSVDSKNNFQRVQLVRGGQ